MNRLSIAFIVLCFLIFVGCEKRNSSPANISSVENSMKYSSQLILQDKGDYTIATVKNPLDTTKSLATYLLIPTGMDLPPNLPDGTIVRTPLKSLLVYTSVYAAALKELGEIDIVKGVADATFYKIPEIVDGLVNKTITDVGSTTNPIVEKVVELSPDAIMLSIYDGMNTKTIDNLGIPILRFTDNFEQTPLGRAEWIKFIGELTSERQKADSIFSEVERSYNELVNIVSQVKNRPTVLVDNMYQGVWYVSGGNSYNATMIKDAGGDYLWKDDTSIGSLSLSFEQVYDKAWNADIWMLKLFGEELTKERLIAIDERNELFGAVKNGGVYYSNTAEVNLFEEFPFHPELLLKDYIKIFHPQLMPDFQMRYFKKMTN